MPGMAAVLPLSALFFQVSIHSSPGRRDNSHQHSKSQEEAEQPERQMGRVFLRVFIPVWVSFLLL